MNLDKPLLFLCLCVAALIFGIAYPPPQPERMVTVSPIQKDRLPLVIDLNSASAELISLLPGIGRSTAERIVAHREKKGRMKTLQELERIEGLGRKRIERVRHYVSLR